MYPSGAALRKRRVPRRARLWWAGGIHTHPTTAISIPLATIVLLIAGCAAPAAEPQAPASTALATAPQVPASTALVAEEPTAEESVANEPTRTPTLMATPKPTSEPTPTPDIQMYVDLDLPEGDPLSGRNVAIRTGCRGCHFNEEYVDFAIGFTAVDGLPPILERGEMRIADPKYTGRATSNLEYIFESIYLPELYVVEGEWGKAMPLSYDYRLTDEKDLADLLAWMAALNDPEFEYK